MSKKKIALVQASRFKKIIDLRKADAQGEIRRNIKYEILIPKSDNSKNKIRTDILKKYAIDMAKNFDGMTMAPSLYGCWKPDDSNDLICDEIVSVFSVRLDSTKAMARKDEMFVEKMAKQIGDELGQSSVMIMTDKLESLTKFIEGMPKSQLPAEMIEKWDEFARAVHT